MKHLFEKQRDRKSIFRSLFAPLFMIMVLQAFIFYFAAVYGGVEESLSQNAADILSERLENRKNEIETQFNTRWSDLDSCNVALNARYADYEKEFGKAPLTQNAERQISFLRESAELLIDTLRHNEVNGIFLILNDQSEVTPFSQSGAGQKYGLCIRDMDQDSNYFDREDLVIERAPSSIIDVLGCSLDSWWEAKYAFTSKSDGDFYYYPLEAAWSSPDAKGADLAYCSGVHQISGSDPAVVSYSIPLIARDGYPYAVLGIELSAKHLATILPYKELNDPGKCCYVLALQDASSLECTPVVATGALYNRCFGANARIDCTDTNATGGFDVTGRGEVALYGDAAQLRIYNNNNPFESRRLTLLAFVEKTTLFAYIDRVKVALLIVSFISLLLGVAGIALISRRFAAPITALARRVRAMKSQSDFQLTRLGITEIDQLVDSIEELNRNVSKNSARTEFFSRMSHDMRTPMNAIISFSSPELLEGATEAVKDDYLEKIHASGAYLLALINEVLDMTKIESNKTELRIVSVQACRLFDTTIPIIEKLAQKKSIQFSSRIEIEPDAYVKADVLHLNQIVMNLLSNAVKFTPENGTVGLSAQLESDAFNGECMLCRIVVSDNGIGMSEAFLQKLYTPFEQENSRREGTGLGLSIAQKLVDLMDGKIACTSKKNVGTTFTVTVPLLKSDSANSAKSNAVLAGDERGLAALKGKHVLLCEDNEINAMIVRRLLEKWGVTMEHAENGKIGAQVFASSPERSFDAILMDVRMPVMDGLEAARTIRKLSRSDAASVPIIAMTANAFEEDEQASFAAGMNAHLAKPIAPDLMYQTLLRLL